MNRTRQMKEESMHIQINQAKLTLVQGDITKENVDAIANAANEKLMGGGGVDGAIHRAGGPQIMAACNEIRARQGGCPTGQAVITTGGNLPAKYVIHTVGPIWRGGDDGEPDLLASCYRESLSLAVQHDIRTIAFPSISTGIYGYPTDEAAVIALNTVKTFLEERSGIDEVRFVLFDEPTYRCYENALSALAAQS
ncbi:MAG: O-acetyl-ADP-ribose deacetylase [Candidatus Poribacteria bacterium]|nr:O-acetyl-ADP-ribose deacetylase [Candidatus Poribacteria bacterium]